MRRRDKGQRAYLAKPPPPSRASTSASDTTEDIDLALRPRLRRSPTVDLSDSFLRHDDDKPLYSKRRIVFLAGGLFGALAACLVVSPPQVNLADLEGQFPSLSLDWISLPDLGKFPELGDIGQALSNFTGSLGGQGSYFTNRDFDVGRKAAKAGLKKKHAVVLIPGIISSGLESWSTDPVASPFFRQRLWGTTSMMRAIVKDRTAWIRTMSLDPETGLDPPGVKLRAAQGFDAASYFIQGYYIWSKIIENLAAIDYDQNDMHLAAYDWRLSYYNLEVRDAYFSRLQMLIEHNLKRQRKKTVLVAHSMGSQVMLYFFKWVEAKDFGGGGPDWVERHIESFLSVGGTFLGVPKASAALLSGEMRDTVELPAAGVYLLEKFFSRAERAQLFRSWAGASSMYLKGGSAVWGDAEGAPDDPDNSTLTGGHIYYFRHPNTSDINAETVSPNLTQDAALPYLLQNSPDNYGRMMESNYSFGIERDPEQLARNDDDHRKWSNALEVRLPNAPSMTIYCTYGHGKTTERAYFYQEGGYEHDETQSSDYTMAQCSEGNETCSETPRAPLDFPLSRSVWIDSSLTLDNEVPSVKSGVINGEGDGTVALISLGAMCVNGWKQKRYNPAGIKVVTHEMLHQPLPRDLRGGPATADHVDILGNHELNEAILRVAAGLEDPISNQIQTRIEDIAAKIKWDE